jgi:hypothetical protein
MNLQQHFERPETPAAGSPVGVVMVKVLEKYPALSFEEARDKATDLIQESAGRRRFVNPRVLSEAELAEQKEHLKTVWSPAKGVKPVVSGTTSPAILAA